MSLQPQANVQRAETSIERSEGREGLSVSRHVRFTLQLRCSGVVVELRGLLGL
jgi:hypothetical protein